MRTALCFESRGPSSCLEGGGYGFHKLPGQGSRQVEPDPFGTADAPRSQQLHSTIRKEWRKETQGRLKRRQLLAETISLWVSKITMAFFNSAVGVLQTLVIALGAGLGIWGAINLLEGYGNDNPGAKSQGMKQLMAGGGVALIGTTLVPLLAGLFG